MLYIFLEGNYFLGKIPINTEKEEGVKRFFDQFWVYYILAFAYTRIQRNLIITCNGLYYILRLIVDFLIYFFKHCIFWEKYYCEITTFTKAKNASARGALDFKKTVCATQNLPIKIGPLQCSEKLVKTIPLQCIFSQIFHLFFKNFRPFGRQKSSFFKFHTLTVHFIFSNPYSAFPGPRKTDPLPRHMT